MPVPVSIDSNQTGLAIAEELSLKTVDGTAKWYAQEPNSYPDFGATFTQVARETINATRQRLKGTITDESAKGGFNCDLTQRNMTRLLQGFFFADAIEKPATKPFNGTQTALTAITATQYQAAAGLDVFKVGHLVNAKNANASNNNGVFPVTAVAAGALTTSKALTVDGAPGAAIELEAVGFRCAAGDIHLSIVGSRVVLASTALDFTTLALNVGEWVFIGGDNPLHNFVTAPANNQGFARIVSIAAHSLQFDLTTFVPLADADGGGLQQLDIHFGKVINNAISSANVKRRTYQLERTLGNDGTGTQSEYLIGAVPDQFTINVPTANKITADLTFIGMDAEQRNGALGVKAGTRIGLLGEAALNTTNDVYLSRLAIVDPTTLNPAALYGFASDIKLVINNSGALTKAIGVLGGFNVSNGDFVVSGTLAAYFASIAAVAAIKAGADVCLQLIITKNNAGMIFDVPLLTLGGGSNKVEKDKPIMVDLTQDAAKCVAGYTMLCNFFEYLPNVAM